MSAVDEPRLHRLSASQSIFSTLTGLFYSHQDEDDEASDGSADDIEGARRSRKYFPSRNMKEKEKGIAPDGDLFANKYVRLSQGVTAYYIIDPPAQAPVATGDSGSVSTELDRQHVILCLHGMTNSSYMYRDLAEHVAARMHCQVLAFDFYGRGRTPWTGAACSLECLVSQTKELLNHLNITELASIIGYDIGAAVAIGLFAKYYNNTPKIANNLVLLSPVGIIEEEYEVHDVHTLRSPYLGELLMLTSYMRNFASFEKSDLYFDASKSKPNYPMIRKAKQMLKFQIQNTPGFCGAVLSTLRNFPLDRLRELYMVLGRDRSTPICVILGKEDAILPTLVGEESDNITSEVFEVSCERNTINLLEEVGHHVLFESFDDVIDIILNFYVHDTSEGTEEL